MQTLPDTQDLVLIGGGHTHALVLRKWAMRPLAGARVTLINPGPTAAYSGMLPGFLAGHYSRDELGIDLIKLARFANARLVIGEASHIDAATKMITVPGRPPIAYDVCSIDIGITSNMPSVPGFQAHAIPAKPLAPFAKAWAAFRSETETAEIAVIGGGVAGAEVAMALHHAMPKAHVRLFDRGRALEHVGQRARKKLLSTIAARGIEVFERAEIVEVQADAVLLEDGRRLPSGFTVGAAGALPFEWVSDIGLATENGSISVGATLQSSDPSIFAVGDCAHMLNSPRPKAGVFAVRQAPILFHNLKASLSGRPLKRYTPQADYLKLISLGRKEALAAKFGVTVSGQLMWRLKDRIDRKFMDQFVEMPTMKPPELPVQHATGLKDALGDKPMCAGCGSKVGKAALQTALAKTNAILGDGDDAAILKMGDQSQVISTDHLRSFTNDPVVMAKIAANHALGDVWAMGATPQAALATLILPRMSNRLQDRTVSEVMAAAAEVFDAAGALIVGGHTSLGAELTIGFTVTGMAKKTPITLAGAQPGLALILTKPLGTGVILAAEMAGRADGADVVTAHASMMQSQSEAAKILAGAKAMTDVTGFGLLGHLWGMCQASDCAAEIFSASVPILPGAAALSAKGVRSSLFPANVAAVGQLEGTPNDLFFDPQTAGGLLAAVPLKSAEAAVKKLQDGGCQHASIIGETVAGRPKIKIV